METYLAVKCRDQVYCEAEISDIFWGFLIFLALFVCCLLAWKVIDRLRNPRNPTT